MPCGPGAPPVSSGDSAGWTATMRTFGFLSFRTRATPEMVPPVPTPATNTSTWPWVSAQISSPVWAMCAAGFAGFVNWEAMIAPGRSEAMRSASATAAETPPLGSVRTSSAPKARTIARRSTDIEAGMTMTTL